jgi:hypothetical protein
MLRDPFFKAGKLLDRRLLCGVGLDVARLDQRGVAASKGNGHAVKGVRGMTRAIADVVVIGHPPKSISSAL